MKQRVVSPRWTRGFDLYCPPYCPLSQGRYVEISSSVLMNLWSPIRKFPGLHVSTPSKTGNDVWTTILSLVSYLYLCNIVHCPDQLLSRLLACELMPDNS